MNYEVVASTGQFNSNNWPSYWSTGEVYTVQGQSLREAIVYQIGLCKGGVEPMCKNSCCRFV